MAQIKKLGEGSVFYGVPQGAAVSSAHIDNLPKSINAEPAIDANYQKPVSHNRWGLN